MAEKLDVIDGGASDILERLKGHDRIVIDDGEGNELTARYPRKVVKDMEAAGVTSQSIMEMAESGTLTGVERLVYEFVHPAFKTDQPKITKQRVLEVYEAIPDKMEFLTLLIGLFTQPMLALTTDPTETRAKFRLV